MTTIPKGPEGVYCPDWKKPMSKVCHTCPLWMAVDVRDNGKDVTSWRCAKLVAAQGAIVSATRFEARLDELVKEVTELRNEMKKSHDANVAIGAIAVQRAKDVMKDAIYEAASVARGGSLEAPTDVKVIAQ